MSPAERERLAFLVEELAEAIHMAGKCLRHGFDSTHPDYHNVSNRDNLSTELGHVMAAVEMMAFDKNRLVRDLDYEDIQTAKEEKRISVKRFLHHNS